MLVYFTCTSNISFYEAWMNMKAWYRQYDEFITVQIGKYMKLHKIINTFSNRHNIKTIHIKSLE